MGHLWECYALIYNETFTMEMGNKYFNLIFFLILSNPSYVYAEYLSTLRLSHVVSLIKKKIQNCFRHDKAKMLTCVFFSLRFTGIELEHQMKLMPPIQIKKILGQEDGDH